MSSEIGRLRRVVVHRPGIELARITPQNKERLLFDDLLWVERAQQEHDRFAAMMREREVEVLYFDDLLADSLADEGVRHALIDAVITPAACGVRVSRALRAELRERPVGQLIDVLLGGLLEQELPDWGVDHLFADLVGDRFHYVLRPLPNLLFMRDNASWIHDGVALNVLATPARDPESHYVRAIYDHHPGFAGRDFPVWYGNDPDHRFPASIEGGDILVLDDRTVMVGMGERTAPAAVEMLAHGLFEAGRVETVIAAHLRQERAVMHLDTVFTMVDVDTFNVFPGILDEMDVHLLHPAGNRRVRVTETGGVVAALREALGRDEEPTMVPTGGDALGRLREQWDDGNNTLALEPGVVVAYARNQETNRRLRDAGIEVLELDASELCRGRGGSRCMTLPLLRDPVTW